MRLRSGQHSHYSNTFERDASQSTINVSLNHDEASSDIVTTVRRSSRVANKSSSQVPGVTATESDRKKASGATGSKLKEYRVGDSRKCKRTLYQTNYGYSARSRSTPHQKSSRRRHTFAELSLSPPPSISNRTGETEPIRSDDESNEVNGEVTMGHIYLKDLFEGLAFARRPFLDPESENSEVDGTQGHRDARSVAVHQHGHGRETSPPMAETFERASVEESQDEEQEWTPTDEEPEHPSGNEGSDSYTDSKGKIRQYSHSRKTSPSRTKTFERAGVEGNQDEEEEWTDEEPEHPSRNEGSDSYTASKGENPNRTSQGNIAQPEPDTESSVARTTTRSGVAGQITTEEARVIAHAFGLVRLHIKRLKACNAELETALNVTQGSAVSGSTGLLNYESSSGPTHPRETGCQTPTDHESTPRSTTALPDTLSSTGNASTSRSTTALSDNPASTGQTSTPHSAAASPDALASVKNAVTTPSTSARPVIRPVTPSVDAEEGTLRVSTSDISSVTDAGDAREGMDRKEGHAAGGSLMNAVGKKKGRVVQRKPKAFLCPWDGCDGETARLADLCRHFERHLQTKERSWICGVCGKKSTRHDVLKRHCQNRCTRGIHAPCNQDGNLDWRQYELFKMCTADFIDAYPSYVRYD